MTPWDAKLLRAQQHVAELRATIDQLKNDGTFKATTDTTGRSRSVRLVLAGQPPAALSTIVGDVLHNTRSALDCLAFAGCVAGAQAVGKQLTPKEERAIYFPIEATEQGFNERAGRCLPLASTDVREAIGSRQPYSIWTQVPDMDPATLAERVAQDQLTALARLSNIDKHRQLHVVGTFPSGIYAGTPDGVDVGWEWMPGPWADGDEVGRWIFPEGHEEAPLWPNADVDLVLQEHLDIGWVDTEVSGFLGGLIDYVRNWVAPCVVQAISRS